MDGLPISLAAVFRGRRIVGRASLAATFRGPTVLALTHASRLALGQLGADLLQRVTHM